MTQQKHKAIRHLERTIIGSRYLLEGYKIADHINSRTFTNNRALAGFLANTFLRSLILTLSVIFNRSKGRSTPTTNLALEKLLNMTFTTIKNTRPDLSKIISESISIMEKEGLDKVRNKKIAHLDLEEITPSLSHSNPKIYEKLVRNAETIISEIFKSSGLKPEEPPSPKTDPALQQLKKLLDS